MVRLCHLINVTLIACLVSVLQQGWNTRILVRQLDGSSNRDHLSSLHKKKPPAFTGGFLTADYTSGWLDMSSQE